jgi:hypothetical protein
VVYGQEWESANTPVKKRTFGAKLVQKVQESIDRSYDRIDSVRCYRFLSWNNLPTLPTRSRENGESRRSMVDHFDPYHKWLGIPPKDQPPNHYRLLALDLFESDPDVIDAAASKQVAYLRTCATGPHVALSQKILNEVAAVRLCLLDRKKKAEYDRELRLAMETASEKESPADDGPLPAATANDAGEPFALVSTVERYSSHGRGLGPTRRKKARPLFAALLGGVVLSVVLLALVMSKPDEQKISRDNPERPSSAASSQNAEPLSADEPEETRLRTRPFEQALEDPPVGAVASPNDGKPESGDATFRSDNVEAESPTKGASTRLNDAPRSLADLLKQQSGEERDTAASAQDARSEEKGQIDYVVWEWHPTGAKPFRLKFYRNGTVSPFDKQSGDPKFTWSLTRNTLVLRWPKHGWVDTMTVSPDGRLVTGKNQYGRRITGKLLIADCKDE